MRTEQPRVIVATHTPEELRTEITELRAEWAARRDDATHESTPTSRHSSSSWRARRGDGGMSGEIGGVCGSCRA